MTPPIRTTPSLANNAHGKEPIRINLHWDIDRDLDGSSHPSMPPYAQPAPRISRAESHVRSAVLPRGGFA